MRDLTIQQIDVYLAKLPAKGVLVLAGGNVGDESGHARIFTKVTGSNGVSGWGESTPAQAWSYETQESIFTTIARHLAPALIGKSAWNLDLITRTMNRIIPPGITLGQPLAKASVDIAIHDMLCRSLDIPVYEYLGGKRLDYITMGYIISSHDPSEAASIAEAGLQRGYDAFKVKIGVNGLDGDYRMVEAVREVIGPDRYLWVDANQGYTVDQAVRQARRLAALNVDCFEQPLPANNIAGLQHLRRNSLVPIGLDESFRATSDLMEHIQLGTFDIAIAKIQRSGGLSGGRTFCIVAEAAGLRLMGSGLTETDLGLATACHLFSAFGIGTPADLNGRQFVESPFVQQPLHVEGGRVYVPDGAGLGIDVDESKLERYVIEHLHVDRG